MNVEEAAAEVYRQCILRERAVGYSSLPLYSPLAQDVSDICRGGHWEHLPDALSRLETARRRLVEYDCADISAALGKLREAAMAEMSKELCQ